MFTFVTIILFALSVRRLFAGPLMFDSMKDIDVDKIKDTSSDGFYRLIAFEVIWLFSFFIDLAYLICAGDTPSNLILLWIAMVFVLAIVLKAVGYKPKRKHKYTVRFIIINILWVAYFGYELLKALGVTA